MEKQKSVLGRAPGTHFIYWWAIACSAHDDAIVDEMLGSPQWPADGLGTMAGSLSPATQAGLGEVACNFEERDFYGREPPTF